MSVEKTGQMSGMEKMLMTFLRAAGFNPQEFAAGISTFITKSQETLADVHAKISGNDTKLGEVDAKLTAVKTLLELHAAQQSKIILLNEEILLKLKGSTSGEETRDERDAQSFGGFAASD